MSGWAKTPMDRNQVLLFNPTLDATISEDHPVRLYDEILRSCDWSAWESQYVLTVGQPPIHPRVAASVILYGLSQGIRSSRVLERQCRNSLDYLWLANGHELDHTTICKFRTRFRKELKGLFGQLGRIALDMGFACLDTVGLDGTRIRANSSRHGTVSSETIAKQMVELDEQIERIMAEAEQADARDAELFGGDSSNQLPPELADLSKRQAKLNQAMAAIKKKESADKSNHSKKLKVPLADPESRILPNKEGGYAPNYTTIATTESRNGFIMDAEVIRQGDEDDQTVESVDRIEENFEKTPDRLLADTNFGSGQNFVQLEERNVEAYIPVHRNSNCKDYPAEREEPSKPVPAPDRAKLPRSFKTKKLDRVAFVYDESVDCYYCPMGQQLSFAGLNTKSRKDGPAQYRMYRGANCSDCELSSECLAGKNKQRTIYRDKYEKSRETMDARMNSPTGQKIYQQRQWLAETPFAVIKACLKLRQFLLRGIDKVRIEWLWACTTFNLAKLVRCIVQLRAERSATVA